MRVIYRKRGENEFELRTPCTFQAPGGMAASVGIVQQLSSTHVGASREGGSDLRGFGRGCIACGMFDALQLRQTLDLFISAEDVVHPVAG